MKKTVGKILRKLLPRHWYKLVANKPLLVPRYYDTVIRELENSFDLSDQESTAQKLLLMRKYAHIIDKGLQRKNAEPGHSKLIYDKLREILKALPAELSQEPTVQWAGELVKHYEAFQNQQFQIQRREVPVAAVSYEDFCRLMQDRRSNRCFTDQLLSPDVVEKLRPTVFWAASSCNKQPVEVFYTVAPEMAQKSLKCCKGGTGFDGAIPSFWVFCADRRGYVWPSELYLPQIDVSLGAQNFFLAATTLGLSGTILSWAQHDRSEDLALRKLLNIPSEFIIVFCAVVGYAEYQYDTPVRKI